MRPGGHLLLVRRGQCRGHPPAGVGFALGRLQVDEAGAFLLPEHTQENAGAVEEGVRLVEVGAAHREIPGVDLVGQGKRLLPFQRFGLPGVLVDLVECNGLAAGFGRDTDDLPGEVANQIAAGNPRRQREALAGGVGELDAARHFVEMGFRVCRAEGVADRGVFHD